MSDCKETISQFLRDMGVVVQFASVPGPAHYGDCVYGGLNLRVWVYPSVNAFAVQAGFGWVPKVGVAPLYRQMLNQNLNMPDAKYCLLELPQGGQLFLVTDGFVEGLTSAQFKKKMDNLTAQFWTNVSALSRDFQISTEVPQ